MDTGRAQYRQAAAALSAPRVIGDVIVAHPLRHLQPAMRRSHDAIGELDGANAKRLKYSGQRHEMFLVMVLGV
jgi:hypothetical protein